MTARDPIAEARDWYDATYVRGAEATEDLPGHSSAWVRYQDKLATEAQAGPEAGS